MAEGEYDVRRADEDDSAVIRELWMSLQEEQAQLDERSGLSDDAEERWENDFPVWLEDEECCLLAAVNGEGEILGFLLAERWYPPPTAPPSREVYIDSLYVLPSYRQQGIGTSLVQEVTAWARQHDIERLRFGVLYANETGKEFWHELGAREFVDIMTVDVPSPSATG